MPGKTVRADKDAGAATSIGVHNQTVSQTPVEDSDGFELPLSDEGSGKWPLLFGFFERVLSDEDKTRRLGYLMNHAIIGIIALAGLSYIMIDKAPPELKYSIAGASAFLITCGRIVLGVGSRRRSRKDGSTKRRLQISDHDANEDGGSE